MIGPARRFLSVFSLVSRVPIRMASEPDFSRADFWLPLIGVPASAAALAGAWVGAALFHDPFLSAVCAILAQYAAFNLFHLDGLLDSADALLPAVSAERRLEILKDSRIGSYAFFAGFIVMAARLAALASLASGGSAVGSAVSRLAPALIAAMLSAPAAGRGAAAAVPLLAKPARPNGLGALMTGFSGARALCGLAAALLPLAAWALWFGEPKLGIAGAAAAAVSALASGIVISRAYSKKVGGFTGDALGAAVELGELLTLLIVAAAAVRLSP